MAEKFISPEPPPTPHQAELLTILIEECAEVQQRATKMLRFGIGEIQPGQNLTNLERLSVEVGDLNAIMERVVAAGLIDVPTTNDAYKAKFAKLDRFMQTTP